MRRALPPLLLMLVQGCLLELGDELACGDGFVDRAAGEACDPEEPASFEDVCDDPARLGACDPDTCQIDRTACLPSCGNGVLEAGEECDPGPSASAGSDVLGSAIACVGLDPLDGGGPYAGGETRTCTADCRWDRSSCDRCGDGRLQADEVCEPRLHDLEAADAFCLGACVEVGEDIRPAAVRCSARCSDDCASYVSEQLGCCIPTGDPAHPRIPCCAFEDQGLCVPGLGG